MNRILRLLASFLLLSSNAALADTQIGCMKDKCDTFYLPSGYQLGCTRESCDTHYLPSGYQLSSTCSKCDTHYVGSGASAGLNQEIQPPNSCS